MKPRAQQICEFLFEKPDSTVEAIGNMLDLGHHLTGVHLYRLKKEGFITNESRGKYRVTEKGQELARKAKAQATQQKSLVEEKPREVEGQVSKHGKHAPAYRVIVQGELFAHDAVVDEHVARRVVNLLINKK
jgi:predicted transcriptional regulator